MPQENYVLKCFSCETFQAHIVKKSKKWECKICGIKQSLKRNYGKGSGKDCRVQVMRLNELRLMKNNRLNPTESEICNETFTKDFNNEHVKEQLQVEKPLTSKWAEYLQEDTADQESESEEADTNFCLNSHGKKRMKKKLENCYLKKRKICREFKKNKMSIQECEEREKKCNFLSFPSNQSLDFHKEKDQETEKDYPNPYKVEVKPSKCVKGMHEKNQQNNKDYSNLYKSEVKPSKYAKYLEENEQENENNLEVVKKTTNIFDSDTTDLNSLLNF